MQHLKLGRIDMVAAWHSYVVEYELRQKRQDETNNDYQSGKSDPALRVHAARDLGPPEMQSSQVSEEGPAHHDVVEVCHDEIGVAQVNIDRQRGEKQTGHATDGEQADEAQRIKHRCL